MTQTSGFINDDKSDFWYVDKVKTMPACSLTTFGNLSFFFFY